MHDGLVSSDTSSLALCLSGVHKISGGSGARYTKTWRNVANRQSAEPINDEGLDTQEIQDADTNTRPSLLKEGINTQVAV